MHTHLIHYFIELKHISQKKKKKKKTHTHYLTQNTTTNRPTEILT